MSQEITTTNSSDQSQQLTVAKQNEIAENEFRINIENFQRRLHQDPPADSLTKTPDGKAVAVAISHIEMTLDEYFFGQWCTENFRFQQIANEIVGVITLKVLHPVTKSWITREGAAAISIMVNSAPSNLTQQERSMWALDMANKKSNALDLGFPKLKADCTKNAAISLGKLLGRDIKIGRAHV